MCKQLSFSDVSVPKTPEEQKVITEFAKDLNKACRDTLARIETGEREDIPAEKALWQKYYTRLRDFCARYAIPNPAIKDKTPFVPTPKQEKQEKALYVQLDCLCAAAEQKRQEHSARAAEILSALDSFPKASAPWSELSARLAGTDEAAKAAYWGTCVYLSEGKHLEIGYDSVGSATVKKLQKRPKKAPAIPHAGGEPVSYNQLPPQIICKARYTVSAPEDLDRATQSCRFQSPTSEESYLTSLTGCTCTYFSIHRKPCKHMAALAGCLGIIEL